MDALVQRAEAEKAIALRARQWESDLKWLMQNGAGQRVLAHFIIEARKRPFTGDERTTNYNLGRQEFIRDFLDSLRTADLTLFQTIERQANEKK